ISITAPTVVPLIPRVGDVVTISAEVSKQLPGGPLTFVLEGGESIFDGTAAPSWNGSTVTIQRTAVSAGTYGQDAVAGEHELARRQRRGTAVVVPGRVIVPIVVSEVENL